MSLWDMCNPQATDEGDTRGALIAPRPAHPDVANASCLPDHQQFQKGLFMAPIKTQISCPQCRMPVVVTLEQLFDATQDPAAKNRFLSGRFNFIDCPNCHYQGQAATPILYHDADKQLLMSFVPIELGLPQADRRGSSAS